MDEKISGLFRQWLAAFEAVQTSSDEESMAKAQTALSDIETGLAETSAEGVQGLAVKLGLHCFSMTTLMPPAPNRNRRTGTSCV